MSTATLKRKPAKPKRPAIESQPPSADTSAEHVDEPTGLGLQPLAKPSGEIVEIPLEQLMPHEDNRTITEDSVDDLIESIRELGQIEPATVRVLDRCMVKGKQCYELLSGERRFRAVSAMGLPTMRCIIVSEETPNALVRLAAANTQRKDLNPIERARLIAKLMAPIDAGGSGLDRLAAGRAVGLNSESGVKNNLRMLKLPQQIQDLVSNGELSERAARRLVPYVELGSVMDGIIKTLKDKHGRENFIRDLSDDDESSWMLERIIDDCTRPMDDARRRMNHIVPGAWGELPKLFECDEKTAAKFDRHEIKVGPHMRIVTTNSKLWDTLQKPHVKDALDRTATAKTTKPKGKSATDSKPQLTPQQKAAADKTRIAEANKRLVNYTDEWACIALRCQLSFDADMHDRLASFGFLCSSYNSGGGSLRDIVTASYYESDIIPLVDRKSNYYAYSAPLPKRGKNAKDDELAEMRQLFNQWGLMLWPVSRKSNATASIKSKHIFAAGSLPDLDRLTRMTRQDVLALSAWCNISISDFWKSAVETGPQRELLAIWLTRHTTEQLIDYASKECKLTTTASKRSDLVELLLSNHTTSKPLPVPKRLQK